MCGRTCVHLPVFKKPLVAADAWNEDQCSSDDLVKISLCELWPSAWHMHTAARLEVRGRGWSRLVQSGGCGLWTDWGAIMAFWFFTKTADPLRKRGCIHRLKMCIACANIFFPHSIISWRNQNGFNQYSLQINARGKLLEYCNRANVLAVSSPSFTYIIWIQKSFVAMRRDWKGQTCCCEPWQCCHRFYCPSHCDIFNTLYLHLSCASDITLHNWIS